jgi:ferredoxin
MIVADRKKIPEIRDMIARHDRVLLVGCGTCVTVCLAGGEREVGPGAPGSLRLVGRDKIVVDEYTLERQCEDAFLDALAAPQDWSTGIDGGPRKVVREDQCIVGLGPKA